MIIELKKKFIETFYNKLLFIISTPPRLKMAGQNLHQGDTNNPRYNCQETFKLTGWDTALAIDFTGAITQALIETAECYCDELSLEEIHLFSEHIKAKLVPALTRGVDIQNPLPDIQNNIERKIKELHDSERESSINNQYAFYGATAIAAAAVTAGVALIVQGIVHK